MAELTKQAELDAAVKAEEEAKVAADTKSKSEAEVKTTAEAEAVKAAAPKTLEEAQVLIAELQARASKAGVVPDWAQKRIDQITASWREEERRTAALRAENEQLKAGKAPTAMSEDEINARAAAIATQRQFDAACIKVLDAGRKDIPEFDGAVQRLHAISPVVVRTADGTSRPNMPQPFVEAVIELENAPQVLAALAKPENNDEAARIMAMPLAKQGVALARFAANIKTTVMVSKVAAPPSTTVTGAVRGEPTLYDDKTTTDEWMTLRNKQVAERRKRA